jgi:hypothetical protein
LKQLTRHDLHVCGEVIQQMAHLHENFKLETPGT